MFIVKRFEGSCARFALLNLDSSEELNFPNIGGELEPLSRLPSGLWIGRYSKSNYPSDVVVFPMEAQEETDLLSLTGVWNKTQINQSELVTAESIEWLSRDGLRIQGDGYIEVEKNQLGQSYIFMEGLQHIARIL